MATPKIAVCLLAYNHADVIEECVRSVLAQDFENYELILSDDCSTDDTWAVIQRLAAIDSRIRPVRTPRNLGMAGNANFAVAQSSAEFIALLHHDDVYRPDMLRRWLAVIERHGDVAFVSNGYAAFLGREVEFVRPLAEWNQGRELLEQILFRRWDCWFRGTAMIRRECWLQVGGMRERFGMLADVDLWMRLAGRWSVGYVAEPLIIIGHAPPSYYPKEYRGWSWPRWRLLYEIHGTNIREHYGSDDLAARVRWVRFRWRVSSNILYWLAYAIYKRRWDMLTSSDEVANEFEIAPARWVRTGLRMGARILSGRTRA